jgi:NAD(P)-dependent dehydrogenase (short-subunit alcohol dehydrogenase family)
MPTTLVTGASRGIGLEFVRQYLAEGWTVHAGARNPAGATQLAALACDRLAIHRLDVADRGQVAALGAALKGRPVDLLVNNAGMWIGEDEQYGRFSDEQWMEQFRVHVFGTMAMCEAFVENVAASAQKRIVQISSGNGSMGGRINVGDYPYNTTKAALNMITKSMALDLAPRGIVAVCFTPGYVATDMSGPDADLTPQESVSAMRALIAGLGPAQSGTFLRYNGKTVPW